MHAYVIRRVGAALVLAVTVVTVVFLLLRLVPGDVVLVMLGESEAPPEKIAATWDFFSENRAGSTWYFSSHAGRWIVKQVNRELGLS